MTLLLVFALGAFRFIVAVVGWKGVYHLSGKWAHWTLPPSEEGRTQSRRIIFVQQEVYGDYLLPFSLSSVV